MTTRSWRGVAAVAGLCGLLALVAFAAAGHAPAGGESRPSASTPSVFKDYLATVALIMMPVGAFLIVWAAFLKRAYKDVPLMKSRAYPFQVAPRPFAYITVLVVFLAIAVHWGHRNNGSSGGGATPAATAAGKAGESQKPYNPHFQWLSVLVLGSVVVGIAGSMMLLTYRRRRDEEEPEAMRVTVAQVLEETLDDIVREPDPRKAVIGAYAKMERTLAARGFPREEFEAPNEYLARILGVVGASGHSARRLTKLFERARFSEHEIDAAMKEDAIDSLSGLRAELLVAT
jgi:Domain of unknown function (DUF4129)